MRSRSSLRQWTRQLLPEARSCAQAAAAQLVRSLLLGFTTNLAQLARQVDRAVPAKGARQWLQRWLDAPQFAPTTLYAHLLQGPGHAVLRRLRGPILLLVDVTCLADGWAVLQVSVPWEGRALPLFRVVQPYQGAGRAQAVAVTQLLAWLAEHLPGPRRRYVLVMDRGFPSHALLTDLQQQGWRFVLRVDGKWRMEHPEYTGSLYGLVRAGWVSATPYLFRDVPLGERRRGPARSSQAHVVCYRGAGYETTWYLVTSEADAALAVALYRQRMQIEQEFRDLKGPLGLDHLATWVDQERVARFLAWVAVYEWRLADLWLTYHLHEFREYLRVGGRLSWIRTAREWVAQQCRLLTPIPDLRL